MIRIFFPCLSTFFFLIAAMENFFNCFKKKKKCNKPFLTASYCLLCLASTPCGCREKLHFTKKRGKKQDDFSFTGRSSHLRPWGFCMPSLSSSHWQPWFEKSACTSLFTKFENKNGTIESKMSWLCGGKRPCNSQYFSDISRESSQ